MVKHALSAVVCLSAALTARSFVTYRQRSSASELRLMAGRGMGMATSPKKKGNNKKKKESGMGKNNGGRRNPATQGTFDVNASMMRLEKRYDELLLAAAKQMGKEEDEDPAGNSDEGTITTEYVVAARSTLSKIGGVKDWVPFAQICVVRPEREYDNAQEMVKSAVSFYCRELSHIAAFGAPVFSTVARNDLQYSVEPMDSFQKYVYESIIEGTTEQEMTKSAARNILGLEGGESDKATIKQAYRTLSFRLHPDRFEGSVEECDVASERFSRVKLAYETLLSGVRKEGVSWYESLGGRSRTEFLGPINLLPLAAAQEQMTIRKADAAIVGLEKDLIQTFVARNLGSAS